MIRERRSPTRPKCHPKVIRDSNSSWKMYSIRSTRNLAIAKRLHSASLQTTVLPVECHGRNKCIGDDTKSPLAEDQTALGKQIRYVERKYISMALSKFCEKLLPHAKFHWNRTNGYWVITKNDLQLGGRPPSWIFEIFIFGRVTAIEFQICRCVSNFIKIGWFFLFRYDILTIFKMADNRQF